ncbi:hypothetical protein NT2_02_01500 [Caenibius tardaugens NBRC 16725]|uniref:Thioredoxin-like fold domain-containing protein n=1 Tax=Caenibius tardaugens NBRC 16725 TaxID=1219035 RepID=U2YIU4_9SPHN|nr:thioredoxin domain-containing protein [Caenibius tardaugens]AZI34565.1 protein-disulfide isomerase [Caenibius tardaugens NBRC 16725]GAD48067.1 hypothetical protein NT2_02_01500 [Caenibius tardaugens NBRC 16725]
MTKLLRRAALVALIAPLSLGLAACGSKDSPAGTAEKGEKIAAIAPPAGKQWADVITVTPEDGYRMGNPDAPLKLVEYASLTCPHCAHFSAEGGAKLREQYVASGVVSYELRNQIHDGLDLTMAMLTRCGTPESYIALSEQVWANQEAIVQGVQANGEKVEAAMKLENQSARYKAIADAAGLTEFFAARGISRDQAATCLAKPGFAEAIVQRSTKQSEELGIDGTPSFLLNGSKIEPQTWEALEPVLQSAGAR